MILCYLPFPSLGGASFALKSSASAFESASNATPICISGLNLGYLLLSKGYHLGAYIVKTKNKIQKHLKTTEKSILLLQKTQSNTST